jgi:hypothetical protein
MKDLQWTFVIMTIIYGVLLALIFGLPLLFNFMIWMITDVPVEILALLASILMTGCVYGLVKIEGALKNG